MKEVIAKIESALGGAQNPVILWSGGKDSTLLLYLCRQIRKDIPIVWFRTGQSEKFVKRMMIEWNLVDDTSILSYDPQRRYLLHDGHNLSMVSEYAWSRSIFPVVSDLVPGSKCSLKDYDQTPRMFHSFDVALCGWRASDNHWLLFGSPFPPADGSPLDNTHFFAPLRELTDGEVWQATKDLGIPYDEEIYGDGKTDEVAFCTACVTGCGESVYCPDQKKNIPVNAVDWAAGLKFFKERFGLEAA